MSKIYKDKLSHSAYRQINMDFTKDYLTSFHPMHADASGKNVTFSALTSKREENPTAHRERKAGQDNRWRWASNKMSN